MGSEDMLHIAIQTCMQEAGLHFKAEHIFKAEASETKLGFLQRQWPDTKLFFRDNAALGALTPKDAAG